MHDGAPPACTALHQNETESVTTQSESEAPLFRPHTDDPADRSVLGGSSGGQGRANRPKKPTDRLPGHVLDRLVREEAEYQGAGHGVPPPPGRDEEVF